MTYQEAVDYLYGRLPSFQMQGDRAYKPGLESTLALCEELGNSQSQFPSVHIGGTNGKGSTSHMIASVLQAAGYRVGLYTSPHLKSFTERIRINGQPIAEAKVVDFVERIKPVIERINPSFFEVTVAMTFDFFAREKVDIAIIEVGMGGRLDSTNVINPLLSLVTNISLDHQAHLGNTLPQIAVEKAGIIKAGVPFILSETPADPDVMDVFVNKTKELGAALRIGDQEYETIASAGIAADGTIRLRRTQSNNIYVYTLDLLGDYQSRNVKGVLTALTILRQQHDYKISEESIKQGLESVVSTTGLKGRWQILKKRPFVVADTAHNPAGLSLTIQQFMKQPAKEHRFVLGFVADKDVNKVLELLPKNGIYYYCQPSVQRALSSQNLGHLAERAHRSGQIFTDVNSALLQVLTDASAEDAVYIGGSTFVVADLNGI